MSETYGRTDMHSCGCIENADGYVTVLCVMHRDFGLAEDLDGPEPWAEYRQSTTACCPRETIPDSCSCLEGCECLCADCECGCGCDCGDDGDDYFDLKAENDFAADLGPEA
jgi:hypothetical protein